MLNKNILWICLPLLSIAGFASPGDPRSIAGTKKWVVNENSSLTVNGSTNVNKFSCIIPAYDQTDTLTIRNSKADNTIIFSGRIDLNITSFDCHNTGMTKQLQKTLKEKQFPVLHITFLSLNKLPVLTATPELITGIVNIEIAGAGKRFGVSYQISQDSQKVIHLLGSRNINFSDFDLIPPQKLGGMIKAKDQLNVFFNLKIKALE